MPGPPDWLKGLAPVGHRTPSGRPKFDEPGELTALMQSTPAHVVLASKAARGPPVKFGQQMVAEVKAFFLTSKLNILLAALPIAVFSKFLGWGDAPTFVLAMLALCPLAERLGFVTEQLAMYTNDTLGGLLNASFGNATEVIISGFALQKGYVRIVQLSLLGSVVSNLLLVMGSAFIAGGIKQKSQQFNQQGINVNCSLMLLGTLAVILPSLLSETHSEAKEHGSELALSRFESVFLLIIYGCYLVFQLYTHRFLFDESEDPAKRLEKSEDGTRPQSDAESNVPQDNNNALHKSASSHRQQNVELVIRTSGRASEAGENVSTRNVRSSSGRPERIGSGRARGEEGDSQALLNDDESDRVAAISHYEEGEADDGEDEDELLLSKAGCFVWLTCITLIIAVLSEWIMTAIKGASKSLLIPMPFLVTIILPIVGNAAEHASAIVFAYKNRIEIALGVAVGSSTQVAVLIVPFCVVLAWAMGQPLDLNFNSFEAGVYFFTVLLAVITLQDGTANWLKGVLLLITYVLVAAGFFMHKDADLALEDVDAAK